MVSSNDFELMMNFMVSVFSKIFALVSQYTILQIPFVGFGVFIIIWLIMHLIPSDIFGWFLDKENRRSVEHDWRKFFNIPRKKKK